MGLQGAGCHSRVRASVRGDARKWYITEDGFQSAGGIDKSYEGRDCRGVCEEEGGRGGLTAQYVKHRVTISLVLRAC